MKSITIAGRWNMNLHSLNNEGTEGNFMQPRMVTVVKEGRLYSVNAISGDMIKHIHADYVRQLALDNGAGQEGYQGNLPLSPNSLILDPNRISTEPEMVALLGNDKKTNAEILDYTIKTCTLTDIHGILMTAKKRMLPRKSRIEFGWVVAIPEKSRTEHFIHVKYAVENATKYKHDKDSTNAGQALFHRPTSSAEYAIIAHIELDKIGFNEVTQAYSISKEAQKERAVATLKAFMQTVLHPSGAGRSQQAPHITGFNGLVMTSDSRIPATTVSPLEDNYKEQAESITKDMNRMGGKLSLEKVESLPTLTEYLANLVERM